MKTKWVSEYFQLASPAVQAKLEKYLTVPKIQEQIAADIPQADHLAWLTADAAAAFTQWVKSFLDTTGSCNITSGHSELNAASEIVDAFRNSISNAVLAWSDPTHSSDSIKALLNHLQLTPVQCSSAEAAIVRSMPQGSATVPVNEQAEPFTGRLSACHR